MLSRVLPSNGSFKSNGSLSCMPFLSMRGQYISYGLTWCVKNALIGGTQHLDLDHPPFGSRPKMI